MLILMAAGNVFAQKRLNEYAASNGVFYREGDIVKLGRGSGENGRFVYLQMGGWARSLDDEENQIGSTYAGMAVNIKAIRIAKRKGVEKVYFTVGGGNISNYLLFIEDAIATCEVTPCEDKNTAQQTAPSGNKVKQLKDLKDLFDAGALTQKEYDKLKSDIINE